MAFNDVDRLYCFALGDFRNFEKCYFDFLVRHHLQKRYEIEEGNDNQAIGNLLDLVLKIIHRIKAYDRPLDFILNTIFSAAETEMKDKVEEKGPQSFYGATIPFLTEENITKTKEVFKNYYEKRNGRFNKAILKEKFWECMLEGETPYKLWGGPDALEMGDDGIPEIVDYKYIKDAENIDLDLSSKLYTLLCAAEIEKLGFKKVKFRIRLWRDPLNESLYEEFDLQTVANLKDFFRLKITKILSQTELNFCERSYCKSCNHKQKDEWIKELKLKKFIQG